MALKPRIAWLQITPLSLLALAVSAAAAAAQMSEWKTYRNQAYGYELRYPADWQVIEAGPRRDQRATWSGNILEEGEVQKVTFQEQEHGLWQGEFQVRVLSNPNRWSLKEWTEHYSVTDVEGGSLIEKVRDTTLGDKSAKRFELFLFDHQGIEIAAIHRGEVYHLSFAGENPNDPEVDRHKRIYQRMVESFRFLP